MSGAASAAATPPSVAPEAEPPALAVAHLGHAFGPRIVLDDVSFTIRSGERVALLGLNGAGKTTLFSLVTRLYNHGGGTIRIFGHEIMREPSEALARFGVVFQKPTMDSELSVA